MISQDAALPTQVLMPSIVCRTRWTFIFILPPYGQGLARTKHHSVSPRNGALHFSAPSDRRLRVWAEIVVERHFARRDVVLLPLRRPLGEGELRLDDLLEQRVGPDVFLGDLVVELKLLLEDRIRRPVELHLVLRLQGDVVLRVTVDRLPLHILRAGF